MDEIFRLSGTVRRDPAVDAWLQTRDGVLHPMAAAWVAKLRACGSDVRETMHDGAPTACVGDAAFAYVAAFKAHVNIGFFNGANLPDPKHLLEGAGKRMRHVKLKPGEAIDEQALGQLIADSYADIKARLKHG